MTDFLPVIPDSMLTCDPWFHTCSKDIMYAYMYNIIISQYSLSTSYGTCTEVVDSNLIRGSNFWRLLLDWDLICTSSIWAFISCTHNMFLYYELYMYMYIYLPVSGAHRAMTAPDSMCYCLFSMFTFLLVYICAWFPCISKEGIWLEHDAISSYTAFLLIPSGQCILCHCTCNKPASYSRGADLREGGSAHLPPSCSVT